MSLQDETQSDCGPRDPKRPCMNILWELCIICQTEGKSSVHEETSSDAIHTRGKFGDGLYIETSRKLACISASDMNQRKESDLA